MILHRFWAGRPMPEEYVRFGPQWEELNPGLAVQQWSWETRHEIEDVSLAAVVADIERRDGGRGGIEMYVQVADVMGYWLVWKYGGVYANCDMQPVRPFPALPDKAWASLENDVEQDVVNAILGAPEPKNGFWDRLLNDLPERYFDHPGAEMNVTTGPHLLTKHARAYPDEIHVFPRTTFNPVHWNDVPLGGNADFIPLPTDSVAVHHWGHRKYRRTNLVQEATQWIDQPSS